MSSTVAGWPFVARSIGRGDDAAAEPGQSFCRRPGYSPTLRPSYSRRPSSRAVPPEEIKSVLEEQGAQAKRRRKLNAFVTVLVVIAMNIYTRLSSGMPDFDLILGVQKRASHLLARLPAHVKPKRLRQRADGSYLAYLHPSD